jgi:hypothetical protein
MKIPMHFLMKGKLFSRKVWNSKLFKKLKSGMIKVGIILKSIWNIENIIKRN